MLPTSSLALFLLALASLDRYSAFAFDIFSANLYANLAIAASNADRIALISSRFSEL